jgi:hypothetical protein
MSSAISTGDSGDPGTVEGWTRALVERDACLFGQHLLKRSLDKAAPIAIMLN